MSTYSGRRESTVSGIYVIRTDDADMSLPLDPRPSQRLWNHSPDGFNWGYGGSGPAQLALALLLDVTGEEGVALHLYQKFKFKHVASWGDTWLWITEQLQTEWITAQASEGGDS